MMSDSDSDVFSDAMVDVAPLKHARRADLSPKSRNYTESSLEHRRRAAMQAPAQDRNRLTDTAVVPLDAWYVLEFKRPGIQNGVYRKLKQGRYEAESRIDLHRMTTDIARREIFDFIAEAHRFGLRCVLIIHGKGESGVGRERSSILKGCVDHWLRELSVVQAFHSAQPRHGGTGAVYVLLRKSEEKKRENREKFAKGRVPYDAT